MSMNEIKFMQVYLVDKKWGIYKYTDITGKRTLYTKDKLNDGDTIRLIMYYVDKRNEIYVN